MDTIVWDATVYFLVMFVCQLVLLMFLFFAPVCDPWRFRGQLILSCSSFMLCSGANSAHAWGVSFLPP